MTWESRDETRCSARLGNDSDALQCVLAYDHSPGHVYVNGTWVPDRHGEAS